MIVISILLMAVIFIIGIYLQVMLTMKDERFINNRESIASDEEIRKIEKNIDPISLIKVIGYYESDLRFLFVPRIIIPVVISILVFIGMPIYGFIGMFDSSSDIGFFTFLYLIFKGFVFSIVLIVKSFFLFSCLHYLYLHLFIFF